MPLSSYAAEIKLAHVGAVVLSGALFFARGTLVLAGRQARAMAAPLRHLSYSIDTILLLAALLLVAILPAAIYGNGWLWTKLLLLPVYVALGWMALHKSATRAARLRVLRGGRAGLRDHGVDRARASPAGLAAAWLDRQSPAYVADTPAVATDCLGRPVSVPAPTGTAQLSWTRAVDTDRRIAVRRILPGYRIKYGMAPDELPCLVEIRDPKVTTWKVTGLSTGTWYFAVVSFDSGFVESDLSGVVSKRID